MCGLGSVGGVGMVFFVIIIVISKAAVCRSRAGIAYCAAQETAICKVFLSVLLNSTQRMCSAMKFTEGTEVQSNRMSF